jgi:hypothetical protein
MGTGKMCSLVRFNWTHKPGKIQEKIRDKETRSQESRRSKKSVPSTRELQRDQKKIVAGEQ